MYPIGIWQGHSPTGYIIFYKKCVEMQIKGGGKAVQSAVTGGAVTAEWRVASRRQDYTSTNSTSKRSNIVSCDTFDLFEAVPNMKVSCSDGSASPHTSVTSNWTALPPNLHFDTSS